MKPTIKQKIEALRMLRNKVRTESSGFNMNEQNLYGICHAIETLSEVVSSGTL